MRALQYSYSMGDESGALAVNRALFSIIERLIASGVLCARRRGSNTCTRRVGMILAWDPAERAAFLSLLRARLFGVSPENP